MVSAWEAESGPNAWSSIRIPFALGLLAALIFLAFTSREAFEATLGILAVAFATGC